MDLSLCIIVHLDATSLVDIQTRDLLIPRVTTAIVLLLFFKKKYLFDKEIVQNFAR